MNELRKLADQLRDEISVPEKSASKPVKAVSSKKRSSVDKSKPRDEQPMQILEQIKSYDNSNHKNMVHVRFDSSTSQLLNQFKMATNVDVTKLVAFAVQALFRGHPELKSIIKQSIQNLEL